MLFSYAIPVIPTTTTLDTRRAKEAMLARVAALGAPFHSFRTRLHTWAVNTVVLITTSRQGQKLPPLCSR